MVMHNFLIDTRDAFRESDLLSSQIAEGLRAVNLREGGDDEELAARIISEDDGDIMERQEGNDDV